MKRDTVSARRYSKSTCRISYRSMTRTRWMAPDAGLVGEEQQGASAARCYTWEAGRTKRDKRHHRAARGIRRKGRTMGLVRPESELAKSSGS